MRISLCGYASAIVTQISVTRAARLFVHVPSEEFQIRSFHHFLSHFVGLRLQKCS